MAITPAATADKVLARLFDFFHRRTPWHRRLWGVGTVLSILEVIEYSTTRRESGLPPDGLRFACAGVRREIALDPGTEPFDTLIDGLLAKEERLGPDDELQLRHLARRIDDQYLQRWRGAVAATPSPPVERTARSVAAHLLDKGFSSDHLYRWLDSHRHKETNIDLAPLLEEAEAMCRTTAERVYQVLIPCFLPGTPPRLPETTRWLDPAATAAWIEEQRPGQPKPRQGGAFEFTVMARDPWAAVENGFDLVARAAARVQVGKPGSETLRPVGIAYVRGSDREFPLGTPRRQVEIHALDRQQALFDVVPDRFPQLDDALQLAAHMETGSAGAAITGGWAAVESLLLRPNERNGALAADRLAALIACSLARAELTPLAFEHAKTGEDDLAVRLRGLPASTRNYQRVRLVEGHLRAGGTLALRSASDQAALDRVCDAISDPRDVLNRIREYVRASLRRLYNQRNLVMHSGSFRSIALQATMRTTPALVGAGLDRVVHAMLVNDPPVEPLALAARAEIELGVLDTLGASWLVDLLE